MFGPHAIVIHNDNHLKRVPMRNAMRQYCIESMLFLFLLVNMGIHPDIFSHGSEEIMLDLSVGFRQDSLHWNSGQFEFPYLTSDSSSSSSTTAPSSSSSSSSSSLSGDQSRTFRWRELHISQVALTGKYINCYNYYFRALADYGRIHEGQHAVRRYIDLGSDILEYSKTEARADKGEVYDFNGGIGYHFRFLCNRGTISPLVGYSYHAQHLHMNHYDVEFDLLDFNYGRLDGVKGRYFTRWKGPWVGVDFTLYMTCDLKLFGSAEYHWVHFRAFGKRPTLFDLTTDRFHQHAKGRGICYLLGASYDVWDSWTIGLVGTYQAWRTRKGTDRVYTDEGPFDADLFVVHWHSMSAMVNIGYEF